MEKISSKNLTDVICFSKKNQFFVDRIHVYRIVCLTACSLLQFFDKETVQNESLKELFQVNFLCFILQMYCHCVVRSIRFVQSFDLIYGVQVGSLLDVQRQKNQLLIASLLNCCILFHRNCLLQQRRAVEVFWCLAVQMALLALSIENSMQ